MATAMAMFPGLKEAFARLSKEDFERTAIQINDDGRRRQERRADAAAAASSGVGTERRARTRRRRSAAPSAASCARRQQQQEETAAAADANPRADVHDDQQRSAEDHTNVTAADVAMPAGFKQN